SHNNVLALPKYLALKSKSNGKYLKVVTEKESQVLRGLLQFSEDRVLSPYAKLEMEVSSESYKAGFKMVHLRFCYNNKYCVRKSDSSTNWISGGADEPEDDRSKGTCTLFKPEFVDDKGKLVRLLHVQLNRYVGLSNPNVEKGYANILSAEYSEEQKDDDVSVFEVVDLEEIVEFPRLVAFKGTNIGTYVKAHKTLYGPAWLDIRRNPDVNHLMFTGNDRTENAAVHEVLPNSDGSFRLRSLGSNKLWQIFHWPFGPEKPWIMADGPLNAWSNDRVFTAKKLSVKDDGNDVVALKCHGNNLFCKRLTADGKSNCLAAFTDNIVDECCQLTVEEPIVSRRIGDIKFYTDDARIVRKKTTEKQPASFENRTQGSDWKEISETETKSSTSTWSRTSTSTITTKLDVGFEITEIPYVNIGTHVEEYKELTNSVTWGKTNRYLNTNTNKVSYTVPPMTKVTLFEHITQETREVPFSYTVKDLLRNGETDRYDKEDGLYTYIVTTSQTKTVQEKLA
ncbi:hypothetical protein LINPERHAP2_LOCUS29189, partial [Linum perenne]